MTSASRFILLIDHGSRSPEGNQVLDALARRVAAGTPFPVRVAHLQWAKPDIAEGVKACIDAGASEIVVVPVFLAPGKHSTRDIPEQVKAAVPRSPQLRVRIAAPLGAHPKIAEIILERASIRFGEADDQEM